MNSAHRFKVHHALIAPLHAARIIEAETDRLHYDRDSDIYQPGRGSLASWPGWVVKRKLKPLPAEALVFLEHEAPGSRIWRARLNGDGFEQTDYDERRWADWQAHAYVRQLNEQRGVSEAAAECMHAGGMYGWDSLELAERVNEAAPAPEGDCLADAGAVLPPS